MPWNAQFKYMVDGSVKDSICLNFESKQNYESWMSVIIEQKRKFGDEIQLKETLQLAIKFGINNKKIKEESDDETNSD